MVVKVIDETPDPEVIKRVSCGNCGVRLEFVPRDIQSYVHHDYGGGSDTIYYIDCPKCLKQVKVKGW